MKKTDLSSSIMDQIKKDHVKIKPKALFVLGSFLLGAGIAIAVIIALLFLSASIFHIRTQNPIGFLRLGILGGPAFLQIFPFWPLLVSVLSIWIGLHLLKKYDISYKKNFLTISLVVIAGLATVAFIADKVGVNERLQKSQPLRAIYKQDMTREDILMGKVVSASQSSMIIENPRTNKTTSLIWDEDTFIQNQEGFEAGDHVGAIGKMVDGEFQADGIHEGGMMWKGGKVKGTRQVRPKLQ